MINYCFRFDSYLFVNKQKMEDAFIVIQRVPRIKGVIASYAAGNQQLQETLERHFVWLEEVVDTAKQQLTSKG